MGRDAGKDIALEVERLKKAQVDGIVLDVRDDGGGSCLVDIAGLFMSKSNCSNKIAGRKKGVYTIVIKIEYDGP
jgi:carboxyl-terminal processing protease